VWGYLLVSHPLHTSSPEVGSGSFIDYHGCLHGNVTCLPLLLLLIHTSPSRDSLSYSKKHPRRVARWRVGASAHGGAPRHGASAVATSGRVILMRARRCHVQGPRGKLLSATGDSRARRTLENTAQRSSSASAGASACPLATQRNPSKRAHRKPL
jgi:hypothetical protein